MKELFKRVLTQSGLTLTAPETLLLEDYSKRRDAWYLKQGWGLPKPISEWISR